MKTRIKIGISREIDFRIRGESSSNLGCETLESCHPKCFSPNQKSIARRRSKGSASRQARRPAYFFIRRAATPPFYTAPTIDPRACRGAVPEPVEERFPSIYPREDYTRFLSLQKGGKERLRIIKFPLQQRVMRRLI